MPAVPWDDESSDSLDDDALDDDALDDDALDDDSLDDDALDDREYPDEDELDDGETDTIACPDCGADVYEDAVQCPNCGLYLTSNTHAWSGKSALWLALGLLGIIAAILALALGL